MAQFIKFMLSWRGMILSIIAFARGSSREEKRKKDQGICKCISVDSIIAGNPKCNCKRY